MKPICWIAALAMGAAICSGGAGWTQEDEDEDEDTGVLSHGVVHNIAEDRKVIRVGGKYEPEGLDFYIQRHFEDLTERMRALEAKLDAIESELQSLRADLLTRSEGGEE
jgi:hypothetical protein